MSSWIMPPDNRFERTGRIGSEVSVRARGTVSSHFAANEIHDNPAA